ncbi:hypothetical protein H0H87_005360, partial [Tephrocybe sp. NHM501043]
MDDMSSWNRNLGAGELLMSLYSPSKGYTADNFEMLMINNNNVFDFGLSLPFDTNFPPINAVLPGPPTPASTSTAPWTFPSSMSFSSSMAVSLGDPQPSSSAPSLGPIILPLAAHTATATSLASPIPFASPDAVPPGSQTPASTSLLFGPFRRT